MTKIRTAIVGCGKVGAIHARSLRDVALSNFVAVCDSNLERAVKFAAEFNVAAFESITKMIGEAGVEAVCVCTPHPLHACATVEAAEAGAHILVEKPLAATLKDCDAMIATAAGHHVVLGVVSQRRFFEPVQRIRAAIDQGKIGTPVLGTTVMLSWRDEAYYRSDPWRGKWETEGGGVLVNQSPHQLDLLQWFMGPIAEISGCWANLNHPYIEVEDTAVACLRFRNGGLGSVVTSLSQRPGIYTKVHIHGSTGASVGVQTDTGATFIAGMSEVEEPPVNDLWTVPGEEGMLEQFVAHDKRSFQARRDSDYYHKLQIQDFLNAIATGRRPTATGEDGRAVVEIFSAIYQSNRERAAVRLPLLV